MTGEPKRRGRPPLTDEQKAAKAAAKVPNLLAQKEAVAAVVSGETASAEIEFADGTKATVSRAGDKKKAAPKKPTVKSVEHDRVDVANLTDEQHQALALQWTRKYEAGLAAKKKADADFKNVAKGLKSELGSEGLDIVKGIIAARTDTGKAMLKASVALNVMLLRWEGLPTGHMDDLFPDADRTPVEDRAFADGKRAGLAGESCTPPHHFGGTLTLKWTEGHAAGQTVLMGGIKQKPEDAPAAPAAEPDPEAGPAKPISWHAQGAAAFNAGEPGKVPDAVPADGRDGWLQGWDAASTAHFKRTSANAAHAVL